MGDGARRWAAINSLRVTALIVLIVVAGAAFLPPLIRFFGRGGQRETVEWLVYVFLGTAFPVIAAALAWVTRRHHRRRSARGTVNDPEHEETSPRRSDETSPRRSDETSPRRSDETSPRRSDETSPRRSDETSPRRSDETSPRRSDETSPRRSDETSPRHSREGGNPFSHALPHRLTRALSGALAVFLALACVAFLVRSGASGFLISTALGLLTLVSAELLERRRERDRGVLLISAVAISAVWASALTLASWTDPWTWATQSVRTAVVLVALAAAAIATLLARDAGQARAQWFRLSPVDALPLLAFVFLSFRTTPIVEFYHWSFWTGPIESIRQGGWLLWDVPSQYGFLSLLMPALVPVADAWQALYLLQAVLYVAVAVAIYFVLKGLRPGLTASVLAFAFTAAALFFRPRTSDLILPAQMTPAGGPMRFLWCYAILLVLVWKYRRGEAVSPRRFAITGTLVWITSVAWSAESAIYCTTAWVGALGVFLLQRAFVGSVRTGAAVETPSSSNQGTMGASGGTPARRVANHVGGGLALLAVAAATAVAVITAVYRTVDGHGPDWASYYEYALLFSGGYSALPVDGYGAVWYLIILFAAVSTAVVHFLKLDPGHPRLFVAAGAWGTIWAVSSYFVSRSHPVNLLSLVPLLVFALAIVLLLMTSMSPAYWVQLVRFAAIPLICVPPALTLAHGGFAALLAVRQTPMSELTAQVPAMDSSLAALAVRAGMKPSDPVFFTSDGRYLLPRWPELNDGIAETNELAWMPKPYEMISTLPQDRRDAYITRFSRRIGRGGWLVQKKSEINPGYESVVRLIGDSFEAVETFENQEWLIRKYVMKRVKGH